MTKKSTSPTKREREREGRDGLPIDSVSSTYYRRLQITTDIMISVSCMVCHVIFEKSDTKDADRYILDITLLYMESCFVKEACEIKKVLNCSI